MSDISFTWDIHCAGLSPQSIADDVWHLPALDLTVTTNTRERRVRTTDNGIAIDFTGNNRDAGTWLRFELVPQIADHSHERA